MKEVTDIFQLLILLGRNQIYIKPERTPTPVSESYIRSKWTLKDIQERIDSKTLFYIPKDDGTTTKA